MALYKLVNASFLIILLASSLLILTDYLLSHNYTIWIICLFPLFLIRPQQLTRQNILTAAGFLSVSGIIGYITGASDPADKSALINRILFLSAIWITAYIQVQRGEVYFSQLEIIRELRGRIKELEEKEGNLKQVRDEEQLRKTLEELKRSNGELERFASVTSHDLQEPVRVITIYTGLLQRKLKDMLDEKSLQYMDFIIDSAMRMNSLIKGLLLYSRVSTKAEEFIETDLNSVFQDVLRDLYLQISETKAFIKSDKLPVIKATPLHMTQLFLNLISNAIKFRGVTAPRIFIQAKENEHEWLLCIRDNGIGIGKEYHEKIFVVFNRLHSPGDKYPGNGIGLSICKKIISNLGGRIWVESQPGEGSAFYFTIPKKVTTE